MSTVNRASTTFRALVVLAAGALSPLTVSAQDLCAELTQAVNHGKSGFTQIKGAPRSGSFGRAGRVFDSTFAITSVSDDCKVWADEDRPQQLRLSCSRISREPSCASEVRRTYERLAEPLRRCVASVFPKAHVRNDPPTTIGRQELESLRFVNVADSVSGYQLDADLTWSVARLTSTTTCQVGLHVEMR